MNEGRPGGRSLVLSVRPESISNWIRSRGQCQRGLSNRQARRPLIACSGAGICGGQVQGETCRGLMQAQPWPCTRARGCFSSELDHRVKQEIHLNKLFEIPRPPHMRAVDLLGTMIDTKLLIYHLHPLGANAPNRYLMYL